MRKSLARCLAYLDAQSKLAANAGRSRERPRMSVAIARQTGSGAIRIAEKLAEYLQTHGSDNGQPWTVFDKNLIAQVLEDHHLPARLAKFLPEDKTNSIEDMVGEILGLHPPSWLVVRQSIETILRLAELGNVILVGRGANAITSQLPDMLRVRLVGSLERRARRIEEAEHMNHDEAVAFIHRSDRGRARYVRTYLHRDISDPLCYDLTINTDHLSDDEVVHLIGDAVLDRLTVAGEAAASMQAQVVWG